MLTEAKQIFIVGFLYKSTVRRIEMAIVVLVSMLIITGFIEA
jgi:hypothetical protein